MSVEEEVVIQTEFLRIQQYPHAAVDCPRRWSKQSSPCDFCYCYVCDVPIRDCDDFAAHRMADGRVEKWRILKRRRCALANTWDNVQELVELTISVSCREADIRELARQQTRERRGTAPNPSAATIDEPSVVHIASSSLCCNSDSATSGKADCASNTSSSFFSVSTEAGKPEFAV